MTYNEIVYYTKTIIDEVSPVDGLEDGISISDFGSDKPIDDFISQVLQEAANETQLVAPTYYLTGSSLSLSDMVVGTDGVGVIAKPSSFLKALRFELATWKRAVNTTVSEGSPRADMQGNKYLRGGLAKPVVVEEKEYLRFYPCSLADKEAGLADLKYAAVLSPVKIPEPLQIPMCWLAASKVLQIVGNINLSAKCKEHFAEMIQELNRKII